MDPCTILPWDSEFFGFRVGRVNGHILTPDLAIKINAWQQSEKVRCLYFLAAADDHCTVEIAEQNSFNMVDIRITFELDLSAVPAKALSLEGAVIRPAHESDIPALRDISRTSYTLSRFYFDTRFPRPLCDELYAVWIEKSVNGYADEVLVAAISGQPVGYITLKRCDAQIGEIGLVGIGAAAQGRGLGPLLVDHGLAWFRSQGLARAEVVTQGRNIRAQRLYQRAGFITQSSQIWYHKWFAETD